MTSERPPILTRSFVLVSLASLGYFIADGVTLALVARFATGPLGSDSFGAGLAYGAFALSALVLRPLAGRLADRHGRRPLLVGGTLLFAAVMLAHLLASSLAVLVALRILLGAAEAFVFVAAFAAEADLAPPQRRGEALTLFSLSLYGGIALGPLLGEAAFGTAGFGGVWLASAAMALVAAALAALVPETRPPVDEPPISSGRLLHPAGILPGLILMTGVWGMAGYFTLMPPYAVGPLAQDGARLFLLAFGGTVIVSRLIGARLPDRIGARRLSGSALLLTTGGLAVMGAWTAATGLLAGTLLLGLGVAFTTPALASLTVARASAAERGAALGTFSVFIDLAFGAGPIAMGAVAAATTTPVAFLSGAVVALAGFGVLVARLRDAPSATGAPG